MITKSNYDKMLEANIKAQEASDSYSLTCHPLSLSKRYNFYKNEVERYSALIQGQLAWELLEERRLARARALM